MMQEEIYELLWECFEPFERGLKDPERRVALDSCIDAASRKLAVSIETKAESRA